MISAIVIAPTSFHPHERLQEAVARTLSALVPAAVADLISDALIAAPADHGLNDVADAAGCRLTIEAEPERALDRAAAQARRERLFFLVAGYAPDSGYIEDLNDFFNGRGQAAALKAAPERLRERMFPNLSPIVGLAAHRSSCLNLPSESMARCARRLRAGRLRTMAHRLL